MAKTPAPPTTFQLRVTLEDIYPPIWRRLLVPADVTLAKLHDVIQAAMGWTNSHLHEFRIGDAKYSIPDRELDDIHGPDHDEQDYRLDQVISHAGVTFGYVYDFGDLCLPFISSGVHQERRPVPRYRCWHPSSL